MFENRYGLERCLNMSITSCGPTVYPPKGEKGGRRERERGGRGKGEGIERERGKVTGEKGKRWRLERNEE